MSTLYSAKRAGVRVLGHRPSLPLELFALLSDFRSSRSSLGAPIALFFVFCLIIFVCGGGFKQFHPCLWKLLSDFQHRFYSSRCVSFPDRHSGSKCEFSCRKTTISWPSGSSKKASRKLQESSKKGFHGGGFHKKVRLQGFSGPLRRRSGGAPPGPPGRHNVSKNLCLFRRSCL